MQHYVLIKTRPPLSTQTFDVCYEAGTPGEDDSMFELVVSAPDKTKTASYLKRAAGELVKNT